MIVLIRSETWLSDNYDNISSILEETIKCIEDNDRIINIQVVTHAGTSRFWIYVEKQI